jgi:hypothetical protein
MPLFYDPDRDPFEEMNDPEILDDTPIGTLRVIPWGNGAAVALMHKHDDRRVDRVIHLLEPGEPPTNAIYGKRFYEAIALDAIYAEAKAGRERVEERRQLDLSDDFVRKLDRFVEEHHQEGAEAIESVLEFDL